MTLPVSLGMQDFFSLLLIEVYICFLQESKSSMVSPMVNWPGDVTGSDQTELKREDFVLFDQISLTFENSFLNSLGVQ